MKACKGCHKRLDRSAFYIIKKTRMLRSRCKKCIRIQCNEYIRANPEKMRLQNRRHVDHKRKYRKTKKGLAAALKCRRNNPARIYAYAVVQRAIKSGKLLRTNICTQCGLKINTHFHHYDGYGPESRLKVIEICQPCHQLEHL